MHRAHKRCGVSTGLHECDTADGTPEHPWGYTFGSGTLNPDGYWSDPCPVCARTAETKDGVPYGSYWPYPIFYDFCYRAGKDSSIPVKAIVECAVRQVYREIRAMESDATNNYMNQDSDIGPPPESWDGYLASFSQVIGRLERFTGIREESDG